MEKLKIETVDWQETNPFYDITCANNGGGYSQPSYTIEFSDGTIVLVDDTSCGDFGSRIFVRITKGHNEYDACYGSMIDNDQEFTIIPRRFEEHIRLIHDHFGYNIPLR